MRRSQVYVLTSSTEGVKQPIDFTDRLKAMRERKKGVQVPAQEELDLNSGCSGNKWLKAGEALFDDDAEDFDAGDFDDDLSLDADKGGSEDFDEGDFDSEEPALDSTGNYVGNKTKVNIPTKSAWEESDDYRAQQDSDPWAAARRAKAAKHAALKDDNDDLFASAGSVYDEAAHQRLMAALKVIAEVAKKDPNLRNSLQTGLGHLLAPPQNQHVAKMNRRHDLKRQGMDPLFASVSNPGNKKLQQSLAVLLSMAESHPKQVAKAIHGFKRESSAQQDLLKIHASIGEYVVKYGESPIEASEKKAVKGGDYIQQKLSPISKKINALYEASKKVRDELVTYQHINKEIRSGKDKAGNYDQKDVSQKLTAAKKKLVALDAKAIQLALPGYKLMMQYKEKNNEFNDFSTKDAYVNKIRELTAKLGEHKDFLGRSRPIRMPALFLSDVGSGTRNGGISFFHVISGKSFAGAFGKKN